MLTVSTLAGYAECMAARWQRKPKGAYHHGDLERALLEAALRTIREDGVQGLTLRGVGARLGVSRTALYRHFDDKTALLARVAAEGFRLLHDALRRAIENASAEGTDILQEMARAYVRFALSNQSHYQTMFGGFLTDWSRYPDLIHHAEAAFNVLLDTIRDEQRHGRIVAGDPIELAEITWSLSHGIATLGAARQLERTGISVDELAVLGCRLLEHGLRKSSKPRTGLPVLGRQRTIRHIE
jgi:AcrR family transcriptional regulator